jgi:hypothetical protein
MTLFHNSPVNPQTPRRSASRMLILTTALALAALPTIGMAQPSWSQTNPGSQTSTPQANADRSSAATLGKPLEVNCRPPANQYEEQPEVCGITGGGEKTIPKALTSTAPSCHVVFSHGDEKTTCVIFQF